MSLEKSVSHYSLSAIKKLIAEGKYTFTYAARKTIAEDFNITTNEALVIIGTLTAHDVYKSMQSHADASLWQDVYHKDIKGKKAYIKLQINHINNAIIISFKRK